MGACTIELNAESPVGVPSDRGEEATRTYSCTANSTCNNDVHVLSCYEARSDHGFNYHPTGYSTVDISATGQSSRPIVLVLVSYEPIEWTLNIPSQIVIDTVIVVSYYRFFYTLTLCFQCKCCFCRSATTVAACLIHLEEFGQ